MFSRRVRFWLVVGLLVSNLAVGILSLFFLRSVNERYAVLFERSVPVVNNLRTLSRELSTVQRLARRIVDPNNEPSWTDLAPQMAEMGTKSRVHALEVSTADLFKDTPHAAAIAAQSGDYDAHVKAFIDLAHTGKLADANRYNIESLRPSYETYQLTLDAAADFVEAHSNSLRDRYTQESRFFGGLLLAFAGWPVIAAGLAVLLLGLLIITLLLTIFTPEFGWGKPASGGPKPTNP